jgi:EEF1A lysine methyltransferase 4
MAPLDFDSKEYWHNRFTTETSNDWLVPPSVLLPILAPYLSTLPSKSSPILHLGSGTSSLANELREKGFENVLNVDYEPLAVERGRAIERDRFGDVRMRYLERDATRFETREKFALVVDKSTADAVSCGGEEALLRMARCVERCLGEGGVWISVSYSGSRFELEGLGLDCEVVGRFLTPRERETDPDIYHYCYKLKRMGGPS